MQAMQAMQDSIVSASMTLPPSAMMAFSSPPASTSSR